MPLKAGQERRSLQRERGDPVGGKKFKFPRRFTRKHCMSKPCKRMGFTEKASCRPYKNCYKPKRKTGKSRK